MLPVSARKRTMILIRLILLLFLSSTSLQLLADNLTITIDGVNAEQELNIRSVLSIQQLNDQEVASPSRLRYLHSLADNEIRTALQPFGFYLPQIKTELSKSEQGWSARYTVSPGKPVLISELDIQLSGAASDDQTFKQLLTKSSLRQGNPLIHSQYEQLKKQLSSLAVERGYFQAKLTRHRVEVNLATYSAA